MKGNTKTSGSPISRRKFLRLSGSATAGAAIVAVSGLTINRMLKKDGDIFWQIDPSKCTFCGRCATDCVLPVSAVRCIHANRVCGYCDLCGGYYRTNVKDLNTAAENMICPTGAIFRKYVEDPYFEYTIDESLCNGCGKCAKGCNSFGNGSLYLQVKQELCKNCNECKISKVCPSGALTRVTADRAYLLKDG